MKLAQYLYDLITDGAVNGRVQTILQRGMVTEPDLEWWEPRGRGKWTSPKHGGQRVTLELAHVEAHLRGRETWGFVPGVECMLGVIDVDAHDEGSAETFRARMRALIIEASKRAAWPLALSTPSGGHLYFVSGRPAPVARWHHTLADLRDAALGPDGARTVEIYPKAPAFTSGVRLPLGLGYRAGDGWVQGRILDLDTLEPRYSDPAEDLRHVVELLKGASIPLLAVPAPVIAAPKMISFPLAPCPTGGSRAPNEWAEVDRWIASGALDPAAGSTAELDTIRQIVARASYLGDDPIATVNAWAARGGHDVRRARRTAEGSLRRLQGRQGAGKRTGTRPGKDTIKSLFKVNAMPRDIAARLMAEPEVRAHVLGAVTLPDVRQARTQARLITAAGALLDHLAAHATARQHEIDKLPELAGEVTIGGQRRRLGVAARELLMSTGYVRLAQAHFGGSHSALYGLDFPALKDLRITLGLPPITVEVDGKVQLVPCPGLPEVIEHRLTGQPMASTIAAYLSEGMDEVIASDSTDPELAAEAIAAIRVDALIPADPEMISALGRYAYLQRTREGMKLGIKFAAVRERRKDLGLPLPRLIAPARFEFVDASSDSAVEIEVEEIDLGIGPAPSAPSNENVITTGRHVHASTA